MNHTTINLRHGFFSLTILMLMLFGFYMLLIQPALSTRSKNADRIENLLFQNSRFTSSKKENDLLKKEIVELNKQGLDKKDFLKNKPPAIVAADLQKTIKALIEESGGMLISTHDLPQSEDEIFPKITVTVHFRANIRTLRNVLYQIAVNKPLLFTDNLLIRKRQIRNRQQKDGQIEIRFDVSGYMKPATI